MVVVFSVLQSIKCLVFGDVCQNKRSDEVLEICSTGNLKAGPHGGGLIIHVTIYTVCARRQVLMSTRLVRVANSITITVSSSV